jgi:transcriptional regulator with XRE-family HTH domain
MAVKDRIKELREQRGLSISELARRINTTQGYVSQIEAGIRTPTLDKLYRIKDALNIEMADFFSDENENSTQDELDAAISLLGKHLYKNGGTAEQFELLSRLINTFFDKTNS